MKIPVLLVNPNGLITNVITPTPPLTLAIMDPVFAPAQFAWLTVTLLNEGAFGLIKLKILVTVQLFASFTTRVYTPAVNPVKKLLVCQVAPLLMLI